MRKLLISIIVWCKKLYKDASQKYFERYEPESGFIFLKSNPTIERSNQI